MGHCTDKCIELIASYRVQLIARVRVEALFSPYSAPIQL